jgi:receptor protein-tyrosine kinase
VELKVYIGFLRRRWWLLVLGPILAGLAAYFVTQQLTPMYQATSTVLVNRTAIPGTIEYNDVLTSERLTNTYAKLVERPAVLDEVLARAGVTLTRSELQEQMGVAAVQDTQLIEISVKDANPELAAFLANLTAQVFAEDNASQLSSRGTVSIAKPAEVPETPVSPKLFFNLAFAVLLGCVVAAGLGLLLDHLDDTVKTSEDIEAISGLPTLGLIGRFRPKTGPAFAANDTRSRPGEAYRQLRTNVHFTALGAKLKTIVITSANAEEGKSTTAANLASVLAQAGEKVILVDTDLRRSSLDGTFAGQTSIGLTGLLMQDEADTAAALVSTRWENLKLLPSGVLPPNPSELLTSVRMIRVILALRQLADYVIFDTPPILAVTDAIILAARADGTILVAQADKTRSEAFAMAVRSLQQANTRVLGAVINRAHVKYAGYYYYGDSKSAKAPKTELAPRRSLIKTRLLSVASLGFAISRRTKRWSLKQLARGAQGLASLAAKGAQEPYTKSKPASVPVTEVAAALPTQDELALLRSEPASEPISPSVSAMEQLRARTAHIESEAPRSEPTARHAEPAIPQPVAEQAAATPVADTNEALLAHLDEALELIRAMKRDWKPRDIDTDTGASEPPAPPEVLAVVGTEDSVEQVVQATARRSRTKRAPTTNGHKTAP